MDTTTTLTNSATRFVLTNWSQIMMKLYTSIKSPYARRARLAIREGGLTQQVEEIEVESIEQLVQLGVEQVGPGFKVPVLVCEDGTPLSESLIIIRYLNDLAGGSLMPKSQAAIMRALELESIASVLTDSLYVRCGERYRREAALQSVAIQAWEKDRTQRCYDRLNDLVAEEGEQVNLATFAIASALDYANWRQPEDDWRNGRDALASYYDRIMQRPSFAETALRY